MRRHAAYILVSHLSLSACGVEDEATTFRATEAVTNQPTAAGEIVAISMVSPQGLFICQKSDGGSFESVNENPVVQLYIDNQLVEERYYNKGQFADEYIVFDSTAISEELSLGSHSAFCTALPDWQGFDPDDDPNDAWTSCSTDTPAASPCTKSGTLSFSVKQANVTPPDIIDLTSLLDKNCGVGPTIAGHGLCSGWTSVPEGDVFFLFQCEYGTTWNITLNTHRNKNSSNKDPVVTQLNAREPSGTYAPSEAGKGAVDRTTLSVLDDGICYIHVVAYDDAQIKVDASMGQSCQESCLGSHGKKEPAGCDCNLFCSNACTPDKLECGLPCNYEVAGYACPFDEQEVIDDPDCKVWEKDSGAFEHRGTCYRCGDGQQCCYESGKDNGTGSYDICPPLDPLPWENQEPNNCAGPSDHCQCDVVPLCGCIAKTSVALCMECIGVHSIIEELQDDFSVSCNAPGDEVEFCEAASQTDFWCDHMGDRDTCFERP